MPAEDEQASEEKRKLDRSFEEGQANEELDPAEPEDMEASVEAQMADSSACPSHEGKHDFCEMHDVSNTVQVAKDHGFRRGWSLDGEN